MFTKIKDTAYIKYHNYSSNHFLHLANKSETQSERARYYRKAFYHNERYFYLQHKKNELDR